MMTELVNNVHQANIQSIVELLLVYLAHVVNKPMSIQLVVFIALPVNSPKKVVNAKLVQSINILPILDLALVSLVDLVPKLH
jgi:hypothetical protein